MVTEWIAAGLLTMILRATSQALDGCMYMAVWEPVCCDGEMFSNTGHAFCEGVEDPTNNCEPAANDECPSTCVCPAVYDPWCCEGQTVSNLCAAECFHGYDADRQCQYGACSAVSECLCTMNMDPHCCDGTLVANPCQAECHGYDVDADCSPTWTSECPAEESIDEGCSCTKEYDPYCCNGETMGNACMAECNGYDPEDDVCVHIGAGAPTHECPVGTAHLVVQGRTSWGGWGSAPDSYCQSDGNDQAAYATSKHGRNIGVGCCSTDGTRGYRPDCNAHPATYREAVDLCAAHDMRLCTEHEMLFGKRGRGITEGTGCWYDAAYQWVSDECDVRTVDAGASGSNKSTASDGEGRTFGDFIPMVLGAAAGIAVIAAIVALVVATRRKKVAEEVVTKMSDAVHVPDASEVSVDGTEAVATR